MGRPARPVGRKPVEPEPSCGGGRKARRCQGIPVFYEAPTAKWGGVGGSAEVPAASRVNFLFGGGGCGTADGRRQGDAADCPLNLPDGEGRPAGHVAAGSTAPQSKNGGCRVTGTVRTARARRSPICDAIVGDRSSATCPDLKAVAEFKTGRESTGYGRRGRLIDGGQAFALAHTRRTSGDRDPRSAFAFEDDPCGGG